MIQRLVRSGIALFGLLAFIFTISRLLPSNPARQMLGPRASDEAVAELSRQMGFNDPIPVQFFNYIVGLFRGDWGRSVVTKQPVLSDIILRFPASFELTTVAISFAIIVGTFFGIKAAVNQDGIIDHASRILALSGVSIPEFWSGIMLQLLIGSWLGLLPLTGRFAYQEYELASYTNLLLVDTILNLNFDAFLTAVSFIVLPAFVLSLGALAQIMRIVRSEMAEQLNKEYIVTAEANGMPRDLLVYKYMLKNAFTSTLTVIGLTYGFLLGNAFVVEFVFGWPGLGRYGVRALLRTDYNAIVGLTLVIGVWFAVIN
ncbi:MAG: ABC transporter permease, partial [Halobacteriaceae archaeon]